MSAPKVRTPRMIEQIDSKRSMMMFRVGGKDTKPEMVVRRTLHSNGYRYRLHARELPGCPDVVFRPRRKAIFVHGCFWHRHRSCARASMPKTRTAFWKGKFKQNCRRDSRNQEDLRRLGWDFLIVWACETRDTEALRIKLSRFVGDVFSGVGMGCGGGCTADLDNADLTGSNPSQAELENATLRNADLT